MRQRIVALVFFCLFLPGCAEHKETDYFSLSDSARHPPAGMAQLVFYYPHSAFWSGVTGEIEINGYSVCGLKSGTFAIRNIAPNSGTEIKVSLCSTNGTAYLKLKPKADTKYYIRVVPNDQTISSIYARRNLTAIRSVFDTPVTTADAPQPNGKKQVQNSVFWVDVISEPAALQEMQGLQICPECL